MRAWVSHHSRSLLDVVGRLARAPMTNMLNIAIIGVALALPTGLYIGLKSLQSFVATTPAEPQLTVFMRLDANGGQIEEIGSRLRKHTGVRSSRYVSREDALSELKKNAALGDVLAGLEGNPLPAAFVIDARDASAPALEKLQAELAGWPKVEQVKLDSDWARRLEAIVRLGRTVVIMLASLLGFALVAVTFNTIRLQILTQREEIEVSKLVGATDSYVRLPFYYQGALLGLGGGILALVLVQGALLIFNTDLARLGPVFGVSPVLELLSAKDMTSMLFFSGLLGWLGSHLSVSRHLLTVEPQ